MLRGLITIIIGVKPTLLVNEERFYRRLHQKGNSMRVQLSGRSESSDQKLFKFLISLSIARKFSARFRYYIWQGLSSYRNSILI